MLTVGVIREVTPGERRVALVPADAARLGASGMAVLVESGAGAAAWFPDEAYAKAGAELVGLDDLCARADILVMVGCPGPTVVERTRSGQVVLGLLAPLEHADRIQALARRGVTAIGFEGLPRTLSRAQSMDALTSQANVAGYKAVLLAANTFGRYLPMLITAAGTAKPARVLVLGAGVAGLQAIGTARRLGAVVAAYDVRPQARGEIESLGARFVELGDGLNAAGSGGYARALTDGERRQQQEAMAAEVARADIVIATAKVPGRPAPLLVTEQALKMMAPGSVLVDLAAAAAGGNIALSQPSQTVCTDNGVSIIGAENLPAQMPTAASEAYSRNVAALLAHLFRAGTLEVDPEDEVWRGVVVTRGGRISYPGLTDETGGAQA
ncbi:MAG TPA: NAD(P) transhydrogenase subunit alpha [Micromonosporaceae bacterium]